MISILNNLIRGKSRQRSTVGIASVKSSLLSFLTALILILNQPAQGEADKTVYVGEEIKFKNTTKGPGEMTWLWDFGDKAESKEKAPTYFYKKPGKYTVKLTVKIPNVAPKDIPESNPLEIEVLDVTVMIKAEKLKIKVGDEIPFSSEIKGPKGTTYSWDFGDEAKGSPEGNPKRRFSKASPVGKPFKVQLGVKVLNIPEKIILSNELLVEVAGMAPPPPATGKAYIGQDIQFYNSPKNPDTAKYKYKWKFDDVVKEGYTVTHRYLTPGRKRYSLEMYIDDVLSSSGDGYIDILPIAVDPSANGKKVLTVLKGIDEVEFSANTEGPPGMTLSWDFGGGAPTNTLENPKVTFEKHRTNGTPYKVVLTVTVPNITNSIISKPILVTVDQKFIKPAIGSITIDRSEMGADGNYTAQIIVEATGTYTSLQLKVDGDPISGISPSGPQSMGKAKGGKHTFEIKVPKPPTSVTQAPVAEKLTVTATIFPNDPDDEKKATGYAKTETLNLTLIPQEPAWLLYVYILAGCILLAIIIMLVVLAKRPVVPGVITLNGTEHFLTSSPLGPKKGELKIELGNLDSQFNEFVMIVKAEKRNGTTQLRTTSKISSKNGTEGEVSANSEYFDFGREFPCSEVMTIEWTCEDQGRLNLTYDTHQTDNFDYGGDHSDEEYEY